MYEKSENVKHLQVNDNCTCKCTIQQKYVPSFIGKRHSQTKCFSDFTTRTCSATGKLDFYSTSLTCYSA